jgi:hypothetical protein
VLKTIFFLKQKRIYPEKISIFCKSF